MLVAEVYLKFVAISTLVMLFASNQAFVTMVLQQYLSATLIPIIEDGEEDVSENRLHRVSLFMAILSFVWVFVPLVKNSPASSSPILCQ